MQFSSLFVGIFLANRLIQVLGHSWAHCTNYKAVISGQDFDESQCEGYIREWGTLWGGSSFATDRGTNYFGSDGAWCQSDFSSDPESLYSDTFPIADYYDGDTIRIVWPAKNHANYECFNFIPDTSMKLYYSKTKTTARTSDPGSLATGEWEVYHDFQDGCTAGTDGCGFQNCPQFCDNTDGAPCSGDITIESSKFPNGEGYYTFMWYWIFNTGSAAYTTCFEAYVHTDETGDGGAATPTPTEVSSPTPPPTPSPTPSPIPTPEPTRPPTIAGGTYPPTESPTEDDSSLVGDNYFIIVPLCYEGGTYNKDTLIDGANNAFSDNVVDWDVRYHTTGSDNSWNATIQTFTDESNLVSVTAYSYASDNSLLCDSIEDEFNDDGSCEVCTPGEIRLYTTSVYNTSDIDLPTDNDNSDTDNTEVPGESDNTIEKLNYLTKYILLFLMFVCFI